MTDKAYSAGMLAAIAALTLAATAPALADAAELPVRPTLADVVKASTPADWRPVDPDNTLYLDLPGGRVVIEMAPAFAPNHVANIKKLVRENYFNGLAIIRSQDNYVVQWGDPDEVHPRAIKTAARTLKAEFTVPIKNDRAFTLLPDRDGYAPQVGHSNGFPSARDPKAGRAWLAHCYGMVGVGRGNDADSGGGTSLYVVTGHAPRHLDRNVTLVGRVISGMSLLSSLPRGKASMGFYDKPTDNVPIKSIRLEADVPAPERSRFEVMRTDGARFKAAVDAQRHRGGPWTKYSPDYIELCNAPIPVRQRY